MVKAGDAVFELKALYLGSGDREVTFESKDANSLNHNYSYNTTKQLARLNSGSNPALSLLELKLF